MLLYFGILVTFIYTIDVVTSKENIALRKATLQSSRHSRSDNAVSSRAVDGDLTSDYKAGSCTHTQQSTNPWWTVDLLWRRQIESVAITNRLRHNKRLRNVLIGSTDVSPLEVSPSLGNFNVCATHVNEVAASANISLPCSTSGRYLVVMLNMSEAFLTLCEVQVFEVQNNDSGSEVPTSPPNVPGPFNYRPTTSNNITACQLHSLSPQEQQIHRQCFRECFTNPCCKAVNATSCEQSYVKTEALDYVKEGLMSEPTEACACIMEYGGTEGTPFSMFSTFEATTSSIRTISVFYQEGEGIKGIHVNYTTNQGDVAAKVGFRSWVNNVCILQPEERITEVVVYKDTVLGTKAIVGLKFGTPLQTCGPYGEFKATADMFQVSGHQLLYLSGRLKDQITSITLHFDYNCTTL